jgi:type I restriction enzyme, R subunit
MAHEGKGMTPEQKFRVNIDALLQQAGRHVCDMVRANIHAARGCSCQQLKTNV